MINTFPHQFTVCHDEDDNTVITFYGGIQKLDFDIPDAVKAKVQIVKIPDSVTEIGNGFFSDWKELIYLKLPDSITKIGDEAFKGCNKLKAIDLSSNLVSIGIGAFWYCTQLNQIHIPDSVLEIGERTFTGCYNLKYAKLPKYLMSLEVIFDSCRSLQEITIPEGVEDLLGYYHHKLVILKVKHSIEATLHLIFKM